jgi:hypothetical protein
VLEENGGERTTRLDQLSLPRAQEPVAAPS